MHVSDCQRANTGLLEAHPRHDGIQEGDRAEREPGQVHAVRQEYLSLRAYCQRHRRADSRILLSLRGDRVLIFSQERRARQRGHLPLQHPLQDHRGRQERHRQRRERREECYSKTFPRRAESNEVPGKGWCPEHQSTQQQTTKIKQGPR